ncbi:MAG TPA: hypothetical protein VMU39_26500 [Solirubrobacteraceae bacterium]|nr:hypothetical protein [Solirubrobacteraceae bacterium]
MSLDVIGVELPAEAGPLRQPKLTVDELRPVDPGEIRARTLDLPQAVRAGTVTPVPAIAASSAGGARTCRGVSPVRR